MGEGAGAAGSVARPSSRHYGVARLVRSTSRVYAGAMSLPQLVEGAARRLGRVPPVLALRKLKYERTFARSRGWRNLHRGLYASFAEARAAIPSTEQAGYQLDDGWYEDDTSALATHDYPALFWLSRLLPSASRLFDFGGHVGVHFYTYRRYLELTEQLRWTVCELPSVVARGEALKLKRGARHLSFVTSFAEADDAQVFLSAGCVQFVEMPLPQMLRTLGKPPEHLVLNKLPLYDRETRVTLQNTGSGFSPCWLFNKREFTECLSRLGYVVLDEWECPDRSLHVPFHPEYAVPRMRGLALRRAVR
jgi:putative methyltransferase (TIGR04325 family)